MTADSTFVSWGSRANFIGLFFVLGNQGHRLDADGRSLGFVLNHARAPIVFFRHINARVSVATIFGGFAISHAKCPPIGRCLSSYVAGPLSGQCVVKRDADAFLFWTAERVTVGLRTIAIFLGRIAKAVTLLGAIQVRDAVITDLWLAAPGTEGQETQQEESGGSGSHL